MNETLKYPISIQSFEKIRTGDYIYVDKSDLVWRLAQRDTCFLCRPRRFGKSLLVSTLEAYFKGRKDLFEGLKIMEYEREWESYPVLHMDFSNVNFTIKGALEQKLNEYILAWEDLYGRNPYSDTLSSRFQHVIHSACESTGKGVVILVDEYDKPLLDVMTDDDLTESNRQTLKAFYSTFKPVDNDIRFVLLTGVTKFSQISVFSGFNQPYDLSMDPSFDSVCGITEKELNQFFSDGIKQLADEYDTHEDHIRTLLKRQYDGYHFSKKLLDIYNPFSIINCLTSKSIDNYWFKSGTPTYLVQLLEGHDINIQKIINEDYESSYFMDYRADAADPLAMLYQSGYLTIKGFDKSYETYRLDFPNAEVKRGFATLIASDYLKSSEKVDSWCLKLDKTLRSGDMDLIRDMFTSFLASIPYEANKDHRAMDFETHYQYTLYLIFRILSCYDTVIEKHSSAGRADMIIETDNFVYIFEFKLDGSVDDALAQIDEMGYSKPYQSDSRTIVKTGINISSKTRTVEDWKSEIV